MLIVFLLVGGLYFPISAVMVGCINCLTRPYYTYKYLQKGPGGRIVGAIAGSSALYFLGLCSFMTIIVNLYSHKPLEII